MKKTLAFEILEEIQSWNGFENFDGTDLEFKSEDPEIFSDCEVSLLMEAIRSENLSVIEALCEAGVNVNRVAKGTGQVPLTVFDEDCEKSYEISKLLIEFGADVNYYNVVEDFIFKEMEIFNSPLSVACGIGNYQHIELLIKSDANINFSLSPNGSAAICSINTESSSYIETLELFIKNGANVNADYGQTLINATVSGNILAVELLLSAGALPNLCSNNKAGNGRSALMYLLEGYADDVTHNEEEYLFKILFENCKSINEQDADGQSILFYAIDTHIGNEGFDVQCFNKIISNKNIDVNISDSNGNTVLTKVLLECEEYGSIDEEYFDDEEHYKISKLIAAGAQTLRINVNRRTPMSIAEEINNPILIQLLNGEIAPSFDLEPNNENNPTDAIQKNVPLDNNYSNIETNQRASSFVKAIRYILFVPVTFIVIGLIYLLFGLLLYWFLGLSTFWLIIILFFFGGFVWGVFKFIASLLMGMTSRLSPSFNFAFWSIVAISVINCIWSIFNAWTLDINYSGKVIFGAIVYSVLVFELTFALILGSASTEEDYDS